MTDEKPIGAVSAPPSPPLPAPSHRVRTVVITLVIIGVGAAILAPQFIRTSHYLELSSCRSNCKYLATALEMYSSDNKGRYPLDIHQLIRGNYLKIIPTCPGAKKDTFSQSYVCSQTPNEFTFCCVGLNHGWEYPDGIDSTNYPQYTTWKGVLTLRIEGARA